MTGRERRDPGCPSDYALDKQAAGELDGEELATLTAHVSGCDRCTGRIGQRAEEAKAFAEKAPRLPPTISLEMPHMVAAAYGGPPVSELHRRRFARNAGIGGALALAAAVLVLSRSSVDTTRTKGGATELGFYVSHGGAVRAGGSNETVYPGDSLRFSTTTKAPRYLGVFSVDGAENVSVYFPAGTTAAPVVAGVDVGLSVSTRLDDVLGKETLYGVFCDAPFELGPITHALSTRRGQPPKVPDGCDIDTLRIQKEPLPK
jgi:hypothetical protein